MSGFNSDGSTWSWTDHMVEDPDSFVSLGDAKLCVLGIERPIDPDEQWALNKLNISIENIRAVKSDLTRLHKSQLDIISNKEGHMDPANANNLPEATYTDIEQEFDSLVRSNNETTTLAVKESLRGKGFWVNQRDVSDAIWKFVQNNRNDYNFHYENGHRVYTYAPIGGGIPLGNVLTMSGGPSGKTHKIVPYKTKRTQTVGTWEVYSTGGPLGLQPTETYTNTTRNKARYEYCKQYGVKYVDTVAKKI